LNVKENLTQPGARWYALWLGSAQLLQSKILCCAVTIACCSLLVACGQDKNEPPALKQPSFALHYIAGQNGRIEGPLEQQLLAGESGQTVSAVPDEGYHFSAWSDGLTSPERMERNLKGDLQLLAGFDINQYPLTYSATEHGSIEGLVTQTIAHGDDGREVKAVPEPGYRFQRWSDGVETAIRIDKKVRSPLKVSAQFIAISYRLKYVAGENGSILGPASQTVPQHGDGRLVQAIPAENYHFAGWSDGVTTAERIDRNLTRDLRVTANFAIEMFPLTYVAGQNGTISGQSAQLVPRGGSSKEVSAVPASGYHFVNWSDAVSTDRRIDTEVTAPLSVTANFAINSYALNYQASEHGSIKGESDQLVAHGGDAASVEAFPEPNYRFVRWSDGVRTARRIDTKVSGSLQVRAEFELETYVIGGSIVGLVDGTSLQLRKNAEETLTVTKNGEFRFATELLNGRHYQVEVLTQPGSPNQTCLVGAGSGTLAGKHVTDVEVVCTLNTYALGGKVSGLPAGDQVVLTKNDSDELILKANGPFSFTEPLDDGSDYLVKLVRQPARKNWTCELANASGTLAGAPVGDLLVDCFQQVLLQAIPGRSKVELTWNSTDFDQVTFDLCVAQEQIQDGGFDRCTELQGGREFARIKSGYQVSELMNDGSYWFQLEASTASGRKTLSEVVQALPFGGLNDTGIDWCADLNKNHRTDSPRPEKERMCKVLSSGLPGQDAVHGRDAAARVRKLAKNGSGSAGFDFVKYCRSGEMAGEKKCPANPRPGSDYDEWACTLDYVTGLSWEIKTNSGLRASDKSYSWHLADDRANGGDSGVKSAACETEPCDTKSYIEAVNRTGLCGYRDWRLPTRRELLSIVDNGRINPAIDSRYFPNTLADYYWTSSSYQDQPGQAWQVYFFYGESKPGEKSLPRPVRLVRGQTMTFGKDNP
jgi:hypothetical protein